jgi:uncharacterized protein with beta-barrel porin domain
MDWLTHNIPQRMDRLTLGWGTGEPQGAPSRRAFLAQTPTSGGVPYLRSGDWAVWASGTAKFGIVDNDSGRVGHNFRIYGGILGVDYRTHDYLFGVHVGYANVNIEQSGGASSSDVDAILLGVHGGARWYSDWLGAMYFDGTFTFGHLEYDTSQNLTRFGGSGTSTSDYSGVALATYMELGVIRQYGRVGVQPYVSVRIVGIRNDAHPILITGGSAITANQASTVSARGSIGLRGLYSIKMSSVAVTLKGRIAYVGEMADVNQSVRFSNLAGGISTSVESARSDRHMGHAGATAFINLSPNVQLLADYSVLIGQRAFVQAVWGAVRVRW